MVSKVGLSQNEDVIKLAYPAEEEPMHDVRFEQDINIKELLQQRDEALKREEAMADRLKLQEVQYSKQIWELRAQVKKFTLENQKAPKPPSSVSSFKGEKKKDGKTREIRELNKTVNILKCEKQELEKRMNGLSQFIEFATNLKYRAMVQCQEKDQTILNLRKQSVYAHRSKIEEVNRRSRLETELDSLRVYIDYVIQKKNNRLRNKSVQTDASIPIGVNLDVAKYKSPFGSVSAQSSSGKSVKSLSNQVRAYSHFRAAESAVNLWQTKLLEQEFQNQTKLMKQRFATTLSSDSDRHRHKSSSEGIATATDDSTAARRFSYPSGNFEIDRDVENQTKEKRITFSIEDQSMPPPPAAPKVAAQGLTTFPKFSQHSKTIAPAAILYNSRREVSVKDF